MNTSVSITEDPVSYDGNKDIFSIIKCWVMMEVKRIRQTREKGSLGWCQWRQEKFWSDCKDLD